MGDALIRQTLIGELDVDPRTDAAYIGAAAEKAPRMVRGVRAVEDHRTLD